VYRAGGAGDLHRELEALALRRQQRPGAETAFWLAAGYLAAGRVQSATDLVREARRRHPDDERLLLLDAVVSYRRSDLGRAETLLREVLVRQPGHQAARFDLALVLQETGRADEARRLLDAASWSDDAWLAGRAQALRDTLR
jgi:predicted Zn-dependent protease